MIRHTSLLILLCGTLIGQSRTPPDFATEILPILSHNCFACHGPDESAREADLRLDLREEAIRSIDGAPPAILPGKPQDSVLVERITAPDPEDQMPPEDSGHSLTPAQIQSLQDWVADGAPYAKHWSFVKPKKSALPTVAKHPIDAFIFKRLKDEGFKPSPEANRRTLIRRVSLDLVGLPPTMAETDAFIADKTAGAYLRVVNRLLASESYGERWAAIWLDLARFADSKGYAQDGTRTIWRYRDWVIDALNENMPFDEFTYQQMAGDLMPKATESQRLATAFHRNTLNNEEGGTDDEEFRIAAVMDRTESSFSIWMGLTMKCARCHSHKYDPISHADYYQAFDFFNHTRDADKNDDRPHLVSALKAGGKENVKTPILMSLKDGKRRNTHILEKGNFLVKLKKVTAGVPAAFNAFPSQVELNRMGFARWLMAKDNPLTARVTVNRFWSRLFGKGLVITEEDFGRQGAQPSHPKLLDHLAIRFRDGGWDMKELLRFIVTSKTYKQRSQTNADHAERDPNNTLLSRGARFRLPAEMIRDQALQVSGLLSRKMHGPSVFPHQPPGLWQAAFSGSSPWKNSTGEDAHRRGLYTFWRRTVPYPSMTIFDAPDRNTCSLRRIRTNTPLQALITLNDPTYMEAAQGLARRMVARDGSKSIDSRVSHGFMLATNRYPTGVELKTLTAFVEAAMRDLKNRAEDAKLLATDPIGPAPGGQDITVLAAYSLVSNIILNLDAVLNRN